MYFIAIVLPEHLNEKIIKLKTYMLEKYKCRVGLKSPAHITLIPPFWMDESKEKELLEEVNQVSNLIKPFQLRTKDFSAFKPRTIFIALERNEDLREVKKTVDQEFQTKELFDIKLEERPFHPHITIATRDLHKRSFAEAWPYFMEKSFMEEFTASGISVLKHNKINWDVICTSQFVSV